MGSSEPTPRAAHLKAVPRPGVSKASILTSALAIALTLVAAAACGTSLSSPSPTPSPTLRGGPYEVKQTIALSDETISGEVCSTATVFVVTTTTSNAEFTVTFTPKAADHGTWAWHYSIPKYGETHDASGDYTIGTPAADGTLTVSMTGSNHVTSAEGTRTEEIPYTFDLVPSLNTACPAAP